MGGACGWKRNLHSGLVGLGGWGASWETEPRSQGLQGQVLASEGAGSLHVHHPAPGPRPLRGALATGPTAVVFREWERARVTMGCAGPPSLSWRGGSRAGVSSSPDGAHGSLGPFAPSPRWPCLRFSSSQAEGPLPAPGQALCMEAGPAVSWGGATALGLP